MYVFNYIHILWELLSEIARMQVVNVVAILSTFALASVAARVIWLAIRIRMFSSSSKPQEYVFFNTQLGRYAICLLIGNMLSGAAGLIGVRWLVENGITGGLRYLIHNLSRAYQFFQVASARYKVHSFLISSRNGF